MTEIRFGLIGLGLMGREFASAAARWLHLTDLEVRPVITAVCDTDPDAVRWFEDRVLPAFAGRVLPYDLGAARVLATLATPARAPLDDAMIGAVAISRDMVLVTRNVKHVEPLGVPYLNPWEQKSGPT